MLLKAREAWARTMYYEGFCSSEFTKIEGNTNISCGEADFCLCDISVSCVERWAQLLREKAMK